MGLKVESLNKSFWRKDVGGLPVLKDINLEVKDGEFACVIGPSGCGKSTLLNIIGGLIKPDGGSVCVDGSCVFEPSSERVIIFQEPTLFPWLTVLENVLFSLKSKPIKKQDKQEIAISFLKKVHLGKFINAFPHELSAGMKQRVAIARALAMDPKILLMDEPFSQVDDQTRFMLHYEIQQIFKETKKTVLFVTSSIEEAVCLADKLFILSARPGRILSEQSVDFSHPRRETDPQLGILQDTISTVLEKEFEKVAKEEMDIEYILTKSGVLVPVDRNLGSNI